MINLNKTIHFILIFLIANYSHIKLGISDELPLISCNKYLNSTAALYGLWTAELTQTAQTPTQTQTATLQFEKHPELANSVSGGVNRGGQISEAAGDVDDGSFTLEESSDGKTISAVWDGEMQPGSCGKEIKGAWTDQRNGQIWQFVLRKVPGWN